MGDIAVLIIVAEWGIRVGQQITVGQQIIGGGRLHECQITLGQQITRWQLTVGQQITDTGMADYRGHIKGVLNHQGGGRLIISRKQRGRSITNNCQETE